MAGGLHQLCKLPDEGLILHGQVRLPIRLGQAECGEHGRQQLPAAAQRDPERLVCPCGGSPGKGVEVVVELDTDEARFLRLDEHVQWHAGRLEPIDHPDTVDASRIETT